jgi:hypothetical protein
MQRAWMTKINFKTVLMLSLFCIAFLATRVPRLWNDTINPDAVNWHARTQQFVNGIKYRQWEKTYQHYHPGISLMWITGVATEGYKQFTGVKTYDIYSFTAFHFISKLAIVAVQLLLSIYIIFVLGKYFGLSGAILAVSLFTFEPFFVGNSRLYHLDILFALFTFAGLLTGYLAVERKSYLYFSLAAVLLTMSFLTKSIGVLAIAYYLAWLTLLWLQSKNHDYLKFLSVAGVMMVASLFVFFPAMWVDPFHYITEIFSESERIGLRRGHDQIVFGSPTSEASIWFYPLVFIVKTSPMMLIGLIAALFFTYRLKRKYLEQINGGILLYLGLFILLYVVFMSLAPKKIDRYVTLVYPFAAIVCFYGFKALAKLQSFKQLFVVLFLTFIIYPLVRYFPYYFTYTSPLLGSAESANRVIGQKPFGIGIYDLRQHIYDNYGYPRLGFLDPKPMREIYGNSKVVDIRVNGVSDYDLLILGMNEVMPDKVLDSKAVFAEHSAVNINGLKYWRIYEKQR